MEVDKYADYNVNNWQLACSISIRSPMFREELLNYVWYIVPLLLIHVQSRHKVLTISAEVPVNDHHHDNYTAMSLLMLLLLPLLVLQIV